MRGVTFYTTESHGGFKLCGSLNALVPDYMRCADGWYEEDCDWSIVATVFPAAFHEYHASRPPRAEEVLEMAKNTLKAWHPDAYERFYGVTLQPGTQCERRRDNAA